MKTVKSLKEQELFQTTLGGSTHTQTHTHTNKAFKFWSETSKQHRRFAPFMSVLLFVPVENANTRPVMS